MVNGVACTVIEHSVSIMTVGIFCKKFIPLKLADTVICHVFLHNVTESDYFPWVKKSKKISNDQELIQSDPISCPQNQKGNNLLHKLTAVYERHARKTE